MTLPEIAVRRPITTIMAFVAIIILGFVSFVGLPIDLLPEIEPPFISVLTQYPGASAQDVETNITEKMETALSGVSDLKKITSTSIDNISVVSLEFEYGTNLDEASNNVRDLLEFVKRDLPDDAETPTIFKFSTNFFPVLFVSVTAEQSFPGLNKLIQDRIADQLKRLPGVGTVQIFGGPIREIQVRLDPQKLEAYNLSASQLSQVLAAENLTLPAGDIKMGRIDYNVRVPGEFTDPNQIKNIVVGQQNGRIIYVKDVAEVLDTLKERTITSRLNQKIGLQLIVQKQSGANTVSVARNVIKAIDELKKDLPSDVKVNIVNDSSEFIISSINNLAEAVLLGGVFVSLVILLFLRQWRGTIIVLLTIPFSLIAAFIYLYFTGNTINIISLSSLSIAIGMVVDDAIVILENISRHIERGSKPREAAIFASSEVGLAVAAATFTIVAVFFPLVFLTGISGILFRQLGFLVTITILVSLMAALTLIPMLSARVLLSKEETEKKPIKSALLRKIHDSLGIMLDALDNFYKNVLTWALSHTKIVVGSALLLIVIAFGLVPFIGTEFMPEADSAQISIAAELETGTKLENTVDVVKRIEKIISNDFPEVQFYSARAGVNDLGFSTVIFGQDEGSNIFNMQMRLLRKNERKRTIWEIAELLRKKVEPIAGIKKLTISTQSGIGSLFGGGGSPIQIDIIGHNLNQTTQIANQIAQKLREIPGSRDVIISKGDDKPELQVILDREKLSLVGLNTALVANSIRDNIYGLVATKYREEGDEYDIFLRYASDKRTTITDLNSIPIKTPIGTIVKLQDIGTVQEAFSPPEITRKDQERVVSVNASVEGRSLGEVATDIQNEISNMDIPQNITIEYGGQIEQQGDAFGDLGLLLVLSLILVYMVMASQFESLLDPLIVMFSIPFAFVGVLFFLLIFNETLSIISFLGSILLVGIVVKNAIVLVDFINITRARGIPLREAIIESGRNRLRPVIMTTLTTLLGMLPLVISSGEGSEIWRPLGISVIGGLTVSTLITLIIVPVLYQLFEKRIKKQEID